MRTIKDDESDIPITPDLFEIRGFFLEVLNARIPVYTETTLMRPPILTIYLPFYYQSEARQAPPVAQFCHFLYVYVCIRRI